MSPIADLFAALVDVDLAEICITSAATLVEGEGPGRGVPAADVPGVAVVPNLAEGTQMRALVENLDRGRRDPHYPDVTPRDAQALREWDAMRKAAE